MTHKGHILHRIKSVKNFSDIKSGELGGWIENEENLSHRGNCWVNRNAIVYGIAKVECNARIRGHAQVYGNSLVSGDAAVYEQAQVYGNATVCAHAVITDSAKVYGRAKICDSARIFGSARVYGRARVRHYAEVFNKAKIYDDAEVRDTANVCGNALVCKDVAVAGAANISGDAVIQSDRDYMVFKNWWSSGRYFTWTRSNDKWKVGCFHGTGEALIRKAYWDSEQSGKQYERIVKYVESIKEDLKSCI